MKRLIFQLSMIVATLLLAASCSEKSESNTLLTVSTTQLNFTAEGGSQTLMVESNTSWTITAPEDFISVSPSRGEGMQEVTVTLPVTQTYQDAEYTLVVRTSDGAKTANVVIKVTGMLIEGKQLYITSAPTLTIGGDAHYEDVIAIAGNVKWEMKGPEWIEAWDGTRWRPLSQNTAVISGDGNGKIQIRTATANTEENNREGVITIAEKLTGDMPINMNVYQLGKHIVMARSPVGLYDSFCTDWVCGSDVKEFYVTLSDKQLAKSEIDIEIAQQEWAKSYPNYVNTWRFLTENKLHYLYTMGISEDGTFSGVSMQTQYLIPSSENQPRAPIEQAALTSEGWYSKIGMNDLTSFYIVFPATDTEWFDYFDGYIAWIINSELQAGVEEWANLMAAEPIEMTWPTQEPIQIFTWAFGKNGHSSSVVDRFISNSDRYAKPFTRKAPISGQAVSVFGCPKSDLPRIDYKIIRK